MRDDPLVAQVLQFDQRPHRDPVGVLPAPVDIAADVSRRRTGRTASRRGEAALHNALLPRGAACRAMDMKPTHTGRLLWKDPASVGGKAARLPRLAAVRPRRGRYGVGRSAGGVPVTTLASETRKGMPIAANVDVLLDKEYMKVRCEGDDPGAPARIRQWFGQSETTWVGQSETTWVGQRRNSLPAQ